MEKPNIFEGRPPTLEGETPFPSTESPKDVEFEDMITDTYNLPNNAPDTGKGLADDVPFPRVATVEQVAEEDNEEAFPKLEDDDIENAFTQISNAA